MPSTNTKPLVSGGQGSIQFAPANSTAEQYDIYRTDVSPSRRKYLPPLLRELLPWMTKAVREVSARHDTRLLKIQRPGMVDIILQDEYDVTALGGWYAFAVTSFTLEFGDRDPSEWPSPEEDDTLANLIRVSTGTDESTSGFEEFEPGPVRLLQICSDTPSIALSLDEPRWRNTRRSQRKEALQTFQLLATACNIDLVVAPTLEQFLHDRHPTWCKKHLTQTSKTPEGGLTASTTDQDEVDPQAVYDRLRDFTPREGRLQLLGAVPSTEGEYVELRDLQNDSRVELSDGTINRYYRELEQDYGFFEVESLDGLRYAVTLTPEGRYAQSLLTDDYRIHHPQQTVLNGHTAGPPQLNTGIVSGAGPLHPATEGQSYEDSLGSKRRSSQGPHPPELSPNRCWLSEQELVDRLATGSHARGVTLVNDRITEFDDGRETHLGSSGDEVHVVVQWGGPLPTLARVATTLLSSRAFDEILTPSRVDPLLASSTALDTLRLGRQMGWISDADYDHIRTQYKRVGDELLRRLRYRNQDPDIWAWIASEAHGLLASATSLYDAVGLNVTIHVRIPDTDQLTRDDQRYQSFVDFMKTTVPKNAVYRGNSAHRMLLERDGDKLSFRFPVDIDDNDRDAELTADWVIIGPGTTDMEDDLVEAYDSVPIREQIASGAEKGIRIPIEIQRANTFINLRNTVETVLQRTNRSLSDGLTPSSVTRLYVHAFGDVSHSSLTCSPFDVAEALLAANRLAPSGEPLTTAVLVRGIGAVSSAKVYPWLSPAARKMMKALFITDEPLKRSEIINQAGISDSSYDRHRGQLANAGLLVEPKTYRYKACVPGQWPAGPTLSTNTVQNKGQTLVLYRNILTAQIRAQLLGLHSRAAPASTVIIG